MRVSVVTLFPELFGPFAETSFVGRARRAGDLELHFEDLRAHGIGKHASVDDTPYGGGSGMVMRVDCVMSAVEAAERKLGGRALRVLMTPQGQPFHQGLARTFAERSDLVLVCGRYEGFDERVRAFMDEEVSLGDFVLTGGEIPAMAIIEACVRLVPGVLGNEQSVQEESFSPELDGGLEYPQYTRPAEYRGLEVPEILKSGDHGRIAEWRRERSRERTRARRPELMGEVSLARLTRSSRAKPAEAEKRDP